MVDLFAADANLWMAGAAVAEAVIVAAAAAFAFGQVREARLLGAGVGRGSGLLVVTRDDKRQDHALAVRPFRPCPPRRQPRAPGGGRAGATVAGATATSTVSRALAIAPETRQDGYGPRPGRRAWPG